MDKRTLKALKGSIRKWEKIVAGTTSDLGGDNCPLCQEFFDTDVLDNNCAGCPVRDFSGSDQCRGTPYYEWVDLFSGWRPFRATSKKKKAAAQAELDFLKSLLPENER